MFLYLSVYVRLYIRRYTEPVGYKHYEGRCNIFREDEQLNYMPLKPTLEPVPER
jgi:hypothetical protein